MKRALQLFYFTLLIFCIIGDASAATISIDWKAYNASGWYVLDLDPQSTYPIVESHMRTTYDLNGDQGVFTHHFNGLESNWSYVVGGITYSGVNSGLTSSSQTIIPTMGTLSLAVPIPPAIWLLGSAFVGLVGFRRKFRNA